MLAIETSSRHDPFFLSIVTAPLLRTRHSNVCIADRPLTLATGCAISIGPESRFEAEGGLLWCCEGLFRQKSAVSLAQVN